MSGIADEDGLTGTTYAYQWIANDGSTDTDIAGATDVSYTLTSAEAGKTVKVRVTFTDDAGNAQTLVSEATAEVPFVLSVADANAHEGTDDSIDFEVSLNPAKADGTVTVDYATSDGTATAPGDYASESGTLTFEPGEISKTVSVPIVNDSEADDGETFTLRLSNAVGAMIADGEAMGTIFNTESPFNSLPQVTGVVQVGNTLSVSFTEAPSGTVTYQWLRGSEEIAGATTSTYAPVAADVGEVLSVRVDGGSDSIVSAATAPVWAAPINPPLADGEEELLSTTMTLGSYESGLLIAGYGRMQGQSFGAMDDTAFDDDGTTYAVEQLYVMAGGYLSLATDTRLPAPAGLVAYWNGHRITGLASTGGGGLLVGRTSQPETEYLRYWSGASDGVRVAVSLRRTSVAAQDALTEAVTPFTVRFDGVPEEHDGTADVTFQVMFNKEPAAGYSYRTMRDETLVITQGGQSLNAKRAKRLNKPNNDQWRITIAPTSKDDIDVSIVAHTDCSATGVICAEGSEALSSTVSETILGPPGLSVADARVEEGPDATVDFAVTLGRVSTSTVTVDYATSETLTFAPGETEKTVSVEVLDDSHDEGEEIFTLTLSNPSGGNAWLKDAAATGTIVNTDAMPQAWMARFGRTVADQVIGAVEGRFSASRTAGVEMTLAGERIGWTGGTDAEPRAAEARSQALAEREAHDKLETMAQWLQGAETGDGDGIARVDYQSRAVTSLDLLTGSSFALTGESASGGMMSLWGRGAVSRFDGREGDLSLDGEVSSVMLGADWARERWTAGLLVSRSEGEGGYLEPEAESGSVSGMGGKIESTLTGLFPYGRYAASDRLTLWGIAGYGTGELTLTPEGQSAMRTDTDLMIGAVGLHRIAVEAPADGGIDLAVKTDALAVRTTTDEVRGDSDNTGNLAATEADVTRLRLGLEGTWRGLTMGEGTLSPVGETGLRHDGGDAETGFGLDLGVGFSWSDPQSGITAELRGRGLLTHESEGFRDRGISGSFAWDPGQGSGRGPKVTLTRTMGASATGGMDALLGHRHLGGLAADDSGSGSGAGSDDLANRRLELRMGYGYSVLEDRFTMTPEFGMGISNGHRDYTLGWHLVRRAANWGSAELSFEARRSENVDSAPQHGVGLIFIARF